MRLCSPTASPSSSSSVHLAPRDPRVRMGSGGECCSSGMRCRKPSTNPEAGVGRDIEGLYKCWEKCWEEGLTPWDLGKPTPAITHLVQSETLPKGRVLVPGCGTGYDVVTLASPDRFVVGLDISESAITKAKKWSSSFPNANHLTFLAADFFAWEPTELFDLIFDYTFFCAIDPRMRSDWAKKIRDILKPDGELITLINLLSDRDEGPPFNNSVADYKEVLEPLGFKALSIEDNELAVEHRKGKEKLARWKRCTT